MAWGIRGFTGGGSEAISTSCFVQVSSSITAW